MKIDGDTTPLVPITSSRKFRIRSESVSRSGSCYIFMAVERANQYIFLKQLRFIIYMRLGDIVYQP